jgi:hypothetical protein
MADYRSPARLVGKAIAGGCTEKGEINLNPVYIDSDEESTK